MILVKPSHEIITITPDAIGYIERVGRTCYKSEDKITPNSAEKFIAMVIKRGHESVIEHASMSVKFVCDRGVSHEIVRHRLASYSQESTRYCNYSGGVAFVMPPWVNFDPGEYENNGILIVGEDDGVIWRNSKFRIITIDSNILWYNAMIEAEFNYLELLKLGWIPQEARSVLPNSLKTEIVMTANFREWREVFRLRTSPAAHPQMREIMIPLLQEVQSRIPVVFDDIKITQ